MAAWQTLASVVMLAGVGVAGAETYSLTESVQAGDCFRVQIEMKLTGELRVAKDGKLVGLPLTTTARHEFPERVLAVAPGGLVQKAVRVYEAAAATITVNGSKSERMLRPERRLIVAQRKDTIIAYAPSGPLTRDELETCDHFDTLSLTGLLPGKPVEIGETWKVGNAAAQSLCAFEGLTSQELTCKLDGVQDNVATVSVNGSASGIDLGAAVKLTVEANVRFDLAKKRLVELVWKQRDEREQGPASPAATMEATTTLTRAATEQPAALSDVALVPVPDGEEPPTTMTGLSHRDTKGRYEMVHAREWRTVTQTDDHLVMRLLDRGDFVAQVTVTPWRKADPGKHLTGEVFKQAMAESAGWEPEEELQAGEVPLDGGLWCYRIAVVGKLDGLRVTQNFYVVAGPQGDQVVLTFTMTPNQVAKLGTRDLALAAGIQLPGVKENK